MTTGTRVPAVEITGAYGAVTKFAARKMLGGVPESLGVMWNNPAVLMGMMGVNRKAEKWKDLDGGLGVLAGMAAAAAVGCSFCLDLNYFMAHNRGLDEAKVREVPRWRESSVFTPLERRVMEYAEAMSQTPVTVTDELVGGAARRARCSGTARADRAHRDHEHVGSRQHRARHPLAGVRRILRARAAGDGDGGRRLDGMSTPGSADDDPFVSHRRLLFTVAYEMLGSAADAEDVLQESWLRWAAVDQSEVRDARAYLVRLVTRQSLNQLRTVSRRREDYVGEWLPEPLLTTPDVADDVELAENVSIAMLTVLETLAPTERAVFVLREVFDVPVRGDRRGGGQVSRRGAADRASFARSRGGAPPADQGGALGARAGARSGSSPP